MIRTQLHLQAREGGAQKVLDFYLERGILARSSAQPGCLSVEIGVSLDESDRITVSALWESETAYQGWLDNPSRADDVEELLPLLRPADSGDSGRSGGSGAQLGSLGSAELTRVVDFRPAP